MRRPRPCGSGVDGAEGVAAALRGLRCSRRQGGSPVHPRFRATGLPEFATLYPALRSGWTSDIYGPSRQAAQLLQRAVVSATGAADHGLVARSDLTGFNWANVPAVLVETGFVTNQRESALLHAASYQWRVARGLAAGVAQVVRM